MSRALLFLALGLSTTSTAFAASNSSSLTSSVSTTKWVLEMSQTRVAAGGLIGDEHHSDFVIRALDRDGKPLVGVPVDLPTLWSDKGELLEEGSRQQEFHDPRVEWSLSGKTVLTDVNGEVHGRFTSGAKEGRVILRGPGESQIVIEQVSNDAPSPFAENENSCTVDTRDKQHYTLSLRRNGQLIPVTGHDLKIVVTWITVNTVRASGKFDEKGLPVWGSATYTTKIEEPTASSSDFERSLWEQISSYIEFEPLRESSPGYYESPYVVRTLPDIVVGGLKITSFDQFYYRIEDKAVQPERPRYLQ